MCVRVYPNCTLHLGKYVEVVNGERSLRPGAHPFPPARLSHRAGLIRKRTRVPAGRLLSAEYNKAENNRCQCPSSPQALPEKLIERHARANSRASRLLAPASCPRVEQSRASELERSGGGRVVVAGQRARGGYPRQRWSLQQCGPGDSMHRDSNWLPDSNSFSRPLRHGRLSRPPARPFGRIDKKREREKALALFPRFAPSRLKFAKIPRVFADRVAKFVLSRCVIGQSVKTVYRAGGAIRGRGDDMRAGAMEGANE